MLQRRKQTSVTLLIEIKNIEQQRNIFTQVHLLLGPKASMLAIWVKRGPVMVMAHLH